jgi:hypothetical protein
VTNVKVTHCRATTWGIVPAYNHGDLGLYFLRRLFVDATAGQIIGTGIVTDRMAISIILFSNVCQEISSTGDENMLLLLGIVDMTDLLSDMKRLSLALENHRYDRTLT